MGKQSRETVECPTCRQQAPRRAIEGQTKPRTVPCRACGRPQDNPSTYSRTDKVFSISGNPLIAYMRLHDYAGPGAIPPIAEKFIAHLDGDHRRRAANLQIAVEVLTEFCQGRRVLSSVYVAVVIEGRSLRDVGEELDRDHKTVGEMVEHAKLILEALCKEAGVFGMTGDA